MHVVPRVVAVFALASLAPSAAVAAGPKPAKVPSASKSKAVGRAQVDPKITTAIVDTDTIPKTNHAYWFGFGGRLDTNIDLDDFAHGDFTISVWVQPEYQFGGAGPIIGERGSGRLFIGQGDYRSGPYVQSTGAAADPMLQVAFGSRSAVFRWPEAADNAWSHLTVTRKDNRIRLYVNGKERGVYRKNNTGPSTLEVVPNDSATPHGTLRVGQRTQPSKGQFYGFIDDIGIFRTALSPSQVSRIAARKRLSGKESHLWRGVGMDETQTLAELPKRLEVPITTTQRARQYKVSRTRRKSDRAVWGIPFHLMAVYPTAAQLPFAKNEIWRVTQGMNDPGPSHNGGTAFASLDFSKVSGGCTGTKVYASVPGKIVNYRESHDPPPADREGNFVHLRHSSQLGFTYMHFEHDGLASSIEGGAPHPSKDHWLTFPPGGGVTVKPGDLLGTIGSGACHLHVGPWQTPLGARIPYPYADFEVSVDEGASWQPVIRGIPRTGMWVRRTKDVPLTTHSKAKATATKATRETATPRRPRVRKRAR